MFCLDNLFPCQCLHLHTVLLYTHIQTHLLACSPPVKLRSVNLASVNFPPGWSISPPQLHVFQGFPPSSSLYLSFPSLFYFIPLSAVFDGAGPPFHPPCCPFPQTICKSLHIVLPFIRGRVKHRLTHRFFSQKQGGTLSAPAVTNGDTDLI